MRDISFAAYPFIVHYSFPHNLPMDEYFIYQVKHNGMEAS